MVFRVKELSKIQKSYTHGLTCFADLTPEEIRSNGYINVNFRNLCWRAIYRLSWDVGFLPLELNQSRPSSNARNCCDKNIHRRHQCLHLQLLLNTVILGAIVRSEQVNTLCWNTDSEMNNFSIKLAFQHLKTMLPLRSLCEPLDGMIRCGG